MILGGHGITAWGETQRGGEANSLEIIAAAQEYLDENGVAEPFGAVVPGYEPLPEAERRAKAAAIFPTIRGLASTDRAAGRALHRQRRRCWTSSPGRSSRRWPSWARPARTTSCAPRSSRWWWTCPATASVEEIIARLQELHAAYRADYRAYYDAARHPGLAADARRRPGDRAGARRRHVLLRQRQADRPGGGRVLRQRDQRDARRRVGVDLRPDPGVGEVPHRVLGAGGGQARPDAQAQAARHPGRAGDRRRVGHRQGDRRSGSPPRAPAWWSPTWTPRRPPRSRREIGEPRRGDRGRARTSPTRTPSPPPLDAAVLAFGGVDLVVNNAGLSISKPLLETTVARLGPAARRDGQGLVPGLPRGGARR